MTSSSNQPQNSLENNLKKLSMFLKRRARSGFKNQLRQTLTEKAETLNESPPKWNWHFKQFFLKRLLPVTATALILIITTIMLFPGGVTGPLSIKLINTAAAKDYYILTANESDWSGITANAQFKLQSKGPLSVKEIKKALTVSPETNLKITQTAENEVTIIPEQNLNTGTIYTFELAAQELPDSPYPKEYQWAYQVSEALNITGTLPGNQSAGAPTNSGIEVYFNYQGVTADDFKNHFTISPAVNGTFQVKGKTGTFIPKASIGLQPGTIYTITITAGLPLSDTTKSLTTDYIFQFETSTEQRNKTTLRFQKTFYDFDTTTKPEFPIYYYQNGINEKEENNNVAVQIYRYASGEDYINALQTQHQAAPSWAYVTEETYLSSTKNLESILQIPSIPIVTPDYQNTIILPEPLPTGYYLVLATKENVTDQVFLQVSNVAAYLTLSNAQSIIWANDLTTGKPLPGAEVEVLNYNLSTKTDSEGIATFDQLINKVGGVQEENKFIYFKISANGKSTYYEAELNGWNQPTSNDNYWQLLQTERQTYHPTDTIYYWGIIQGRKNPIQSEATLILSKTYLFYELKNSLEQMTKNNEIVFQKNIHLQDGIAFEDKIDLEKIEPWQYTLAIIQDNHILAQTNLSVENYILPAYQISLETDKDVLYAGETTIIHAYARFFEGTPVSNVELRYTLPNQNTGTISTDENGEATFSFTATLDDQSCSTYCPIEEYQYLIVTPLKEELADIQARIPIQVFRSKIEATNFEITTQKFYLKTQQIDLNQIAQKSTNWENRENIYSGPAPQTRLELALTRIDWVKTATGEYYDEIDKTVHITYRNDRIEVPLGTTTLFTDEKGELNYTPTLEADHEYDLNFTIYDAEGHFYKDHHWVGQRTFSPDDDSSYLILSEQKAEDPFQNQNFTIGEAVNLKITNSNPELSMPQTENTRYLFIQTQNGITNHLIRTTPQNKFTFKEDMIPNINVQAILFDGKYFSQTGLEYINYDQELKRLNVEVSLEKNRYEPGEKANLTIKTSSQNKQPTSAQVNVYLVDEAYYALFEESFRDPLPQLYSAIGNNLQYTYSSESKETMNGGGKGGCFIAGTQILMTDGSTKAIEKIETGDRILTRQNEWNGELMPATVWKTYEHLVSDYLLINEFLGVTGEHILFINGKWQLANNLKLGDVLINKDGQKIIVSTIDKIHTPLKVYNFEVQHYHTYFANGIYVHNDKGRTREDFRDTALFELVQTDSNGQATLNFEFPDNITSWRVVATAVKGGDIQAGYGHTNIEVSKKLFTLPVVNTQYLIGDKPQIPIRAYGDALNSDTSIEFKTQIDTLNYTEEKTGLAFATTYFTLPNLTQGTHRFLTSAKIKDNTDSLALPFTVEQSHLTKQVTSQNVLSNNFHLQGAPTERTKLTFLNNEISSIYDFLLNSLFETGDRVDQITTKTLSRELLNQYFNANLPTEEFPTFLYESGYENEGITLFPYSDSDLKLTAQLVGVNKNLWSLTPLKNYFISILNDKNRLLSEKIKALYGLANLEENYLSDLNYLSENFDLGLEDQIYTALAYSTYGAQDKANDLFLKILDQNSKLETNTLKITTAGATQEDELSWTALMATLAEQLGSDRRDVLWNYVIAPKNNENMAELILLEKLLYTENRLARGAKTTVSFTINNKKISLVNNEIYEISLLPTELKNTTFSNIQGEIGLISSYEIPIDLATIQTDSRLQITRKYLVNGQETTTFKPGDMVEVHFTYNIPNDLEGAYRIMDYLPSGLQSATQVQNFRPYQNSTGNQNYRMPYHHDQQKLSFYIYCSKDYGCQDNAGNTGFYYLARVINKGEFITEPSIIQGLGNSTLINTSGTRDSITIP
ncbi:MAG: large extracellular alpha-helical protein [Candidatus Peregrinibacteria bacterium GW2011_GWE2_39_6]|nr:MAG: large extracellular alpha-helical protein [Candidatus Peregrinibacteria bacterium GW2011_GWF2_39_17]KKR26053.1 MAG: large extracellular alpha-helical protein [Candidatus Peregrinibacteria bacterium GW2011_GWE2_39_6]HCW32739.1 hypothetical protein [Candidatus Peregrinibacteria bacterium]